MKDEIGHYILNDIDTDITSKTRIYYSKNNSTNWQYYSNLNAKLSFQKIKTFFNLSPHFEFSHYANHASSTGASVTRLSQAYVDFHLNFGVLSIGERRLKFERGRFLSDSTYALTPRTFNQISFHMFDDNLKLFFLTNTTSVMSDNRHYFSKGSYIFAYQNIVYSPLVFNFHSYLFEDLNNTYSFNGKLILSEHYDVESTVAYQTEPSIRTTTFNESSSLFYDLILTHSKDKQIVKFGTRFFQGGKNGSTGFQAPYSSGYSWDGITNTYQPNIRSGFTEDYRSIFATLSFPRSKSQTITIDGFLFRNNSLSKNLGGEINIIYKEEVIKDSIFWFYKIGQFISGSDSSEPSELKMWLDFLIRLDDS